jgi:hypothetical protein
VIVGVAREVRNQGLGDDSVPEFYVVRSSGADDSTGSEEYLSPTPSRSSWLSSRRVARGAVRTGVRAARVDPMAALREE